VTDRKSDSLGDNLEDTVRIVREVLGTDRKDLRTLLYKDIILNALKCKRDELDILDLKVINRAVAEFRRWLLNTGPLCAAESHSPVVFNPAVHPCIWL